MPFKKGLANTTSYIERYINTAYDQVLTVYNNLANIIIVAGDTAAINNINDIGDLTGLDANITLLLDQAYAGIKDPCVVASTANLVLSGEQTIDGVALTLGRVLAKDQTDPIENGIYDMAAGAWTRAADWDGLNAITDVVEDTTVPVSRGTANADTWWKVTNTAAIVVGTTAVTIIQGLTKVGIAVTSTVVDDVADTTGFPVFMNEATGDNALKSDAAKFKYNAATGQLDASIINTSGNAEIGGDANITGDSSVGGNLLMTGIIKEAKGAALDDTDVAAGTNILTVGADGNSFNLSGFQDIAGIATIGIGTTIVLFHTESRTISYGSGTALSIPGQRDRTITAGDLTIWQETATAVWRLLHHEKGSGNYKPMAGKGIDFNENTGSAGETNSVLSWFEEGTWVPHLMDASLNPTPGAEGDLYVATTKGRYTRIGRCVMFEGTMQISDLGTLNTVQDCRIGGLPLSCNADTNGGANFHYGNSLALVNAQAMTGLIPLNTKYIVPYQFDSAAGTTGIPISEISVLATLHFTGHYTV